MLDFLALKKVLQSDSASSTSLVGFLLLHHSFTLFHSFDPPPRVPSAIVISVNLVIRRSPRPFQKVRASPPCFRSGGSKCSRSERRGGGVLAVTLAGGAHVMSSELLHATTAGVHLWICCHLVNNAHAALKRTLPK